MGHIPLSSAVLKFRSQHTSLAEQSVKVAFPSKLRELSRKIHPPHLDKLLLEIGKYILICALREFSFVVDHVLRGLVSPEPNWRCTWSTGVLQTEKEKVCLH